MPHSKNVKIYDAAYRAANREKRKAQMKAYYAANREKRKAQMKAYDYTLRQFHQWQILNQISNRLGRST